MRYLLVLSLVLSNCKWQVAETIAQVKNTSEATVPQDITKVIKDLSGEYTCPEKLSVNDLRIDFLGAGVQTMREGKFVRLFYRVTPLCYDYIEVMRCKEDKRSDLTCRGGKSLFAVSDRGEVSRQLNNPFGETVNRAGLDDCWSSIISTQHSGCTLLGGVRDKDQDPTGRIYAAEHVIDVAAPAGQKFFYLARPCVHHERINELGGETNANCAQRLAVSNTVDDFEPFTFDEELSNAREKVDRLAGRLNYMTEHAYNITKKFNAALIKHQEQDIKRQRGKALRQGIAVITGMVVGAAGALFTPGVGAGSVGAGLDAGHALGAAFADIIASQDDYPTSCTECDDWRAKLIEVVGYTRDPAAADSSITFMKAAEAGEAGFVGDAGYLYQQVLLEYGEALKQLKTVQDADEEYARIAAGPVGSKGGPP